MNYLNFHPWLLLYPISAITSLILAYRVLKGGLKTLSSKSFLFFTLSIFFWEILVFCHRIAPDKDSSRFFLNLASIPYSLNPFFLQMTVLFLWKEDPKFYLLILPAIPLYIIHFMFTSIDLVMTPYGWSYTLKLNLFSIINYLVYFLCLLFSCFIILFLIIRVKSGIIRRKLLVILSYFILFYVFGVFGLNILLIGNPEMPPPGGINTFLFFLGVSYAFSMKEKAIFRPSIKEIKDLLIEQYTYFLNKFVELVPGEELGQSIIELEKYLTRIGLGNVLIYDSSGKLTLKSDVLDKADLITAMEETLRYLKDKPWGLELAESLLPVLNAVYMKITDKSEFKRIIIRYEDFLKKTDLIYGLAGGRFLSEVEKDDSLKGLPDWQACLRLCRRLISTIIQDFYIHVGNAVESKVLSFSLLNRLRISNLGQVETKDVEEVVKAMPPAERIPVLLDNFIPFIAWMIEELYKKLGENFDDIVKRLRITLRLNMDVAMRTMVYSNLVESLSGRIPPSYVSMLKLAEGFSIKDLSRFSSRIGLDHEKLIGKSILLEFEPGTTYPEYIRDYVIEALAHEDMCLIVTRKGSPLEDKLQDLRNIRFIHPSLMTLHTTLVSESEVYVSLQDVVQILESLGRNVKFSPSPVFIVFDSITDFLTQHGFEKTYRLIRSILELNPKKVSLMVTLNIKAWGENVKSTLEELLNITIRAE